MDRKVTSFLKLKFKDYPPFPSSKKCGEATLTIWRPEGYLVEMFQEGKRYR
jgi:hypothetical protein